MRFVVPLYVATMLLVAAITAVALAWCHVNHIRVAQGPVLYTFSPARGIHLFDVAVLGVELVLVALLTATLLAGFSRRR